jgi:hypothetical protein
MESAAVLQFMSHEDSLFACTIHEASSTFGGNRADNLAKFLALDKRQALKT